jgi:hypothetical protein
MPFSLARNEIDLDELENLATTKNMILAPIDFSSDDEDNLKHPGCRHELMFMIAAKILNEKIDFFL